MDSASVRRPFWDALAALADSNHIDKDIRELLIQLGDRRADTSAQSTEWGEATA